MLVAGVCAHPIHLKVFCMSDFDFGDALEDAIENRQNTAGFIFAQGAANQRAAQLKSAEDQLAVDKKRARTEEERLSVEKRRLQIEEERLVVERDAKSAAEALAKEIRFLRGIMVDIGDDLVGIRKGASIMLSGQLDQAITLRLAHVQVLLKLIGDRSHVLCDLGDLKEFRRLGSEFTQVSRECHQKGLSPGDPLQRVVDEIGNFDKWGAAAKALLDRGRWMLRSDLFEEDGLRAGLTRLAAIRVELENFIQTFDADVERVSRQLPLYWLDGHSLNSSMGVIWELLHENTPWAKWFNPLNESIQGLGGARQWVNKARAQLAKIGPREALARAEANDLVVALDALAGGDPQKARMLSARPISERSNDRLWGVLELRLQEMEAAYLAVYAVATKRWYQNWDPYETFGSIVALRQTALWVKVKTNSEWGNKLKAFETKAHRGKETIGMMVAIMLLTMIMLLFLTLS